MLTSQTLTPWAHIIWCGISIWYQYMASCVTSPSAGGMSSPTQTQTLFRTFQIISYLNKQFYFEQCCASSQHTLQLEKNDVVTIIQK